MRQIWIFIVGAATGALTVSLIKSSQMPDKTITVRDTVRIERPIPLHEAKAGEIVIVGRRINRMQPTDSVATAAMADSDSVAVALPRVIRTYEGGNWRASVSGVDPQLENLTFEKSLTTTQPKRWSVSITAGAALTPRGLQPMIGIGVSYAIFNF